MSSSPRTPPSGGAFSRRFTAYTGIFFDQFDASSAWIRERARLNLPPLDGVRTLVLRGTIRPHPDARGIETTPPGLHVSVNGVPAAELAPGAAGPWELRVLLPSAENITLACELTGVGPTNFFAWLGRVTGLRPWQRFRA